MWWKRRPPGKLAAPPAPQADRPVSGFALFALATGLVFPLLGLSILIALVVDRLVSATLKRQFAL
jgi:uncharacterized iron-regulated membrane protein